MPPALELWALPVRFSDLDGLSAVLLGLYERECCERDLDFYYSKKLSFFLIACRAGWRFRNLSYYFGTADFLLSGFFIEKKRSMVF